MKTPIAKVATVAAVVCAIAVGGVAVSVFLSGPNWIGMAQQIEGYSFTHVGGENPQWTSTNDETQQAVQSAVALPDVMIPALQQKIDGIQAESTAATERRTGLEAQLAAEKPLTDVDRQALEARLVKLREEIASINDQTAQQSAALLAINQEISDLEALIEDRRSDVQRHKTLVGVVDADIRRLQQLRQQLADLIVQIDGDLATASRREAQLLEILGASAAQ